LKLAGDINQSGDDLPQLLVHSIPAILIAATLCGCFLDFHIIGVYSLPCLGNELRLRTVVHILLQLVDFNRSVSASGESGIGSSRDLGDGLEDR
jgi:hypothetical protein